MQFKLSTYKREDGIDWEVHELLRADDERHLATENQLRKVTIGEPKIINSSIAIIEYDPVWPTLFALEADRIRAALGARVLRLEHVGSTSVPGLAAKPIIDILLVVLDTRDEAAYVSDLEGDRLFYERTKRGLARQTWKYVQNYADAKTTIVEEILARATKAG